MLKLNSASVCGNKDLLEHIEKLMSSGRFPHAVTLQGDAGLGKRTMARFISNALVCSDEAIRPCGRCRSCIQAAAGSHPDIRIIEGEKKSGDKETKAISVAQLDTLIAESYKAPESADCKVHMFFAEKPLSEAVQNKLLKIIEEPPPNNYYILVVKSNDSLLPTIRSRSISFTLLPPAAEKAAAFCEKNSRKSYADCLEAVKLFGGNIGKALTFLNGGKGAEANEIARQLASLIMSPKTEHEILKVSFPMVDSREIFTQVCDLLTEIFRDAVVFSSGGNNSISIAPDEAHRLAQSRSRQRLMKLTDICTKYKRLCEGNGNKKLLHASFCASLRAAINGER